MYRTEQTIDITALNSKFVAIRPHELSVVDGVVDEVGVDEHEGRVQEAMTWLKWAE